MSWKLVLMVNTFFYLNSVQAIDFEKLNDGLYGTVQVLDLYKSRGPKWVASLKTEGWSEAEGITKGFDEAENFYDSVLSCVEDKDASMEGYEPGAYELEFKVYAVKSKEKMEAFQSGKSLVRPKTIAYALRPYVQLSYSVDDHSGVCEVEPSVEYFFFDNNKKTPVFLGTKYEYEEGLIITQ